MLLEVTKTPNDYFNLLLPVYLETLYFASS